MDSVYKVVEVIGTSKKSWEDAATNAVKTASKSLKDLRVAEITKLDMSLENGKIMCFRARVSLSFKTTHAKPRVTTGYAPLMGVTTETGPFWLAKITRRSPPAIIAIGTKEGAHSFNKPSLWL